jgi:hypothetical protein
VIIPQHLLGIATYHQMDASDDAAGEENWCHCNS